MINHFLNYQKLKSQYGKVEEVPIVIVYYYKGEKGKYSTGVSTKIKCWSGNSENPVSKSDSGHQRKNLRIKEVELQLRKVIDGILLKDLIPYPKLVTSEYNRVGVKKEKETKKEYDFFLLLDEFNKSLDINIEVTTSTKKTIRSILHQIKNYLNEIRRITYFELDRFDEEFIENYKWYCVTTKKLSNSTIHKHFRQIRSMINWCKRRGFSDYTFPKFNVQFGENDIVFLQRDEILKLFNCRQFDFETPEHTKFTKEYFVDTLNGRKDDVTRSYTNWEVYKDMLIFGCGVGCRFSDLVRLKIDNVKYKTKDDPHEYIKFNMVKTKKEVRVPFNSLTYFIYKKYSKGKTIEQYIFPTTPRGNVISNQKFNENLKELSKVVGLNRRVIKREFVGRDVKGGTDMSKPLYEVISSHIVRRTFIREGVNSNLPYHVIRSMSGHTNDKVFQGYFNTLTEEIEKGMEKMFVFDLNIGIEDKSSDFMIDDTTNRSETKGERMKMLLTLYESGDLTKEEYLIKLGKLM